MLSRSSSEGVLLTAARLPGGAVVTPFGPATLLDTLSAYFAAGGVATAAAPSLLKPRRLRRARSAGSPSVSSALDTVPGGVITLSSDLRILAANRRLEELVGWPISELAGVLIDSAQNLVASRIPAVSDEQLVDQIADQRCGRPLVSGIGDTDADIRQEHARRTQPACDIDGRGRARERVGPLEHPQLPVARPPLPHRPLHRRLRMGHRLATRAISTP